MGSVLITGASRGIGAGVARRLAQKGFDLVLWARSGGELDAVARDCRNFGVSVRSALVDVADPASVATAGEASLEGLNGLRGCVVNAGMGSWGRIAELSDEDWRAMIGTNLDGAFFTLRTALPRLARCRFSQLVSIGSDSAMFSYETRGAYCASKWGLNGLIETSRRESRAQGVRVTNLVMSRVDTFFRGKQPGERPNSLSIDEVAEVIESLFLMAERIEIREIHLASMFDPFGPFPEHFSENERG